jgi:DNA polymerase
MADDPRDELAEIVRDVAAYAGYLRDIGDAYLSAGAAPGARSTSAPAEAVGEVEMPKDEKTPSLFGGGDEPEVFESIGSTETLEQIRDDLGECIRCKLHATRTKIVFGEGNADADLMFIGEGPGADEDATGRPFVGAAGQLLDKIIGAIGLKRDDVYIANVVKCRPPQNRKPEKDESGTCQQFLFRQIAAIRPRVIVVLGATPAEALLNIKLGITKARGQFYDYHGIPVMATFHPAYLLRDPTKKREVWEDMKQVRERLQAAGR